MSGPADCTKATRPHMLGRVLRPDELVARTTHRAAPPDPALAAWVDHYWSVQWHLGADETFPAATIDDPYVNLTAERGDLRRDGQTGPGTWLTGPVTRGRFDVTLYGTGSVVGIKFRLGGAVGFFDADLPGIRDRTVPAATYAAGIDRDWENLPDAAPAAASHLNAWLLARLPAPDPGYDQFRRALAVLTQSSVVTLADLADGLGRDPRTVQRLFRRYAGVGPKAIIARARVIDAVAALDGGWEGSMAELAHTFGWFDQAHFTRDFRRVTGETPKAYATRRAPA